MKLELIKNVVIELKQQLSGARVSKIHQPLPEVLVFKLWNGKDTLRLLVSTEGQKSRIHLTEQSWPNPHIPPRFSQLLRARITRINSISVVNDDRIVQLDCTGKHGDCRLLFEIIGKRSNLILVDGEGVIIDVLKRIVGDGGSRSLLAGQKYAFPAKNVTAAEQKPMVLDDLYPSWNDYVDKLYTEGEYAENKLDFSRQLQLAVNRQIKKIKKRIVAIEKDYEQQQNFEANRQAGDLLLANLHSIRRGMTEVELYNFYLQPAEPIIIKLDPLLEPQQNAQMYFKRYKKGRIGQDHSKRRLLETRRELEWLEQVDYQLKDTVKNSDIEEIAVELRKVGLLKDKNRLHSKKTLQPSKPHVATSPSGFKIVWGRNNRQNDEISTKILKGNDLWFHAANASGSHVVMKIGSSTTAVIDTDLYYAASIAAGYSKLKNATKVEVMQAEAKNVHKPKHCKAGLVNVLKYVTLLVPPLRLD